MTKVYLKLSARALQTLGYLGVLSGHILVCSCDSGLPAAVW